jgi:CRP/FNR family transcriptional regulator
VAVSASPSRRIEPLPLTIAVRAGAVLASQGETGRMLWQVRAGALWDSVVLPEGRELALGILGPGDLIGEPDGSPSVSTVRSLRVCHLRTIAPSDAADLLAARARRAASLAADLAWADVPTRLLARLRDLADRFGRPTAEGTAIGIRLSQDQLAHLCGSTRETVNRSLRMLVVRGDVRRLGAGRYVVIDRREIATPLFGRPGVRRRLDFRPPP